jgi:hypothetical protein
MSTNNNCKKCPLIITLNRELKIKKITIKKQQEALNHLLKNQQMKFDFALN